MSNWRLWLGLGISAVALLFLLTYVDVRQAALYVADADLLLLSILAASVPIDLWLKAERWRLLFVPNRGLTTNGLMSALCIGYMVSVFVPFRAGELVRAYLVAQGESISAPKVLATVFVEKVMDVLALVLIVIGLYLAGSLPPEANAGAFAAIGLVVVCLVAMAVLLTFESGLLRLVATLEGRIPWLQKLNARRVLRSFNEGMAFVHEHSTLAPILGLSTLIWLVAVVGIWAALASVGTLATFAVVLFVLVTTNLSMVVPSGPGYVGVYHWAVVFALTAFGVDASQGAGAAFLLHTTVYGTILVLGLIYLWRGRYALSQVWAGARRTSAEAAD